MARYTGPNCKMCRREGCKLYLKGERCTNGKCAFDHRSTAPGQHGAARKKVGEYGKQLREKQKARRYYGVLEGQFKHYYEMAEKMDGITWWNLVDGGAAPGEPSYSGLFDANLAKKPSYYILDELINKEWTTNLTLTADHSGKISFRGFKGDYKITYKNRRGEVKSIDFRVE